MKLSRTGKSPFTFKSIYRYLRDSRGIAAIEFAMLAPMLGIMYVGCVELSDAMTVNRKVTSIASATADLVTQEKEIDDDKIADILDASAQMIVPYDDARISIVVTCVIADVDTGETTVLWSDDNKGGGIARAPDSEITIPQGLITNGESVILTEISYAYEQIVVEFIDDELFTITDRFYLRPRRTKTIERL